MTVGSKNYLLPRQTTTQDAEHMTARLATLAALVIVGLAGCASAAPVSTPTTAPPVVQPSPTATPEPVVPAELVVRGAGVELYDSEGTQIGSFIWADETADALEVLELAFGLAPTPGTRTGDGTHFADFDSYDFTGFIYFSANNLDKPRNEYFLPSTVQVDTGEPINGVSIRTLDELAVGGTLAEVLALSPAINYVEALGTAYLVDAVDPAKVLDLDHSTDMVAAVVDPDGTIVRILAPYQSRLLS